MCNIINNLRIIYIYIQISEDIHTQKKIRTDIKHILQNTK